MNARNWVLHGLEFVDNASLDPASETDAYTKQEHFTLDYSKKTAGTEWQYTGCTLNRFKYPNDPRYHTSSDGAWVRRINGQRFLILTDMYTSLLQFYRFSPSTDGETAIPCAAFSEHYDGSWPPYQPAGNDWLWVDKNGNGDFDATELEATNDYPYRGGWWVDSIGNVWKVVRRTTPDIAIIKYPLLGLSAQGVPQYSNATKVTMPAPAIFTDPHKIEYYPSTDVMYLTGFTTDNPSRSDAAGSLGSEVVRYDSWSRGNRTPRWRIVMPLMSDEWPDAASMSVCGEYLFVAGVKSCRVIVYNVATGDSMATITPGLEVGSWHGWIDIPYGVRAFKRANGEYVIFVEDDANAKVIMYRWCPSGNCTEPIVTISQKESAQVNASAQLAVRAISRGAFIQFSSQGPYAIQIYTPNGREVYRHIGTAHGNVSLAASLPTGAHVVRLNTEGYKRSCIIFL